VLFDLNGYLSLSQGAKREVDAFDDQRALGRKGSKKGETSKGKDNDPAQVHQDRVNRQGG